MVRFSVFIPTYNAQRWIARCLESIFTQQYPQEKVEVVVVDGNSTDRTHEILKRYPSVRVFDNPKQLAHYAFPIYGRHARGELTVMFAADNELKGTDWFLTIDDCFNRNDNLSAAWCRLASGAQDSAFNKYCALIQSEPLSFFVNKNLHSYLSKARSIAANGRDAAIFSISRERPLVWGANGLTLKFDRVKNFFSGEFVGDNDIFQMMVEAGNSMVAYVPGLEVIHHHAESVSQWVGKLERNYRQHFLQHYRSRNMRWAFAPHSALRLALWVAYAAIPLLSSAHSIFLVAKGRTRYWLYHPLANFLQLLTYARVTLLTSEGRGFLRRALKPGGLVKR
jgi:glycosyltransferase involved in cell wall biosynthesis